MEAQGEKMYSSYSFTASALDGGVWSASGPGRALPPGKGHTRALASAGDQIPTAGLQDYHRHNIFYGYE
jgi:hypothetical protein